MHKRTADQLARMDPEKRAKVEAALARLHTPERLAAEEADREEIARERSDGGEIEATPLGTAGDVADLARLAGRLRSAREARGLSLDDVAAASGIERSAVSKLERGATNPTFRTLARYAEAIGMGLVVDLTPIEAPVGR